jgi:hypothetical protein
MLPRKQEQVKKSISGWRIQDPGKLASGWISDDKLSVGVNRDLRSKHFFPQRRCRRISSSDKRPTQEHGIMTLPAVLDLLMRRAPLAWQGGVTCRFAVLNNVLA